MGDSTISENREDLVAQYEQLKRFYYELEDELNQAQTRVISLEKERTDFESKYSKERELNTALIAERDKLDVDIQSLQEQLSQAKKAYDKLQKDHQAAIDNLQNELNDALTYKEKSESLTVQLERYKDKIESMAEIQAELKETKRALEARMVDTVEAEGKAQEIVELNAKISDFKEKLAHMTAELKTVTSEKSAGLREIERLRNLLAKSEQEIANLTAQNAATASSPQKTFGEKSTIQMREEIIRLEKRLKALESGGPPNALIKELEDKLEVSEKACELLQTRLEAALAAEKASGPAPSIAVTPAANLKSEFEAIADDLRKANRRTHEIYSHLIYRAGLEILHLQLQIRNRQSEGQP